MRKKKIDRIKGAVYGFAIGDAMGATTEFMTEEQIKRRHGKVTNIVGGGWLNLPAGQVTDDTQMTLCVMDAIMAANGDSDAFRNKCIDNFIDWFRNGPLDVGSQCAMGIIDLIGGVLPSKTDRAGNGSLMRALPCALVDRFNWNDVQSRLTHNNDMCSSVVQNYTRLIQNLLNGKYTYVKRDLLAPSGFILNTFNNALYWANEESFEDAIVGAVNHGGDSDTIAAIAGSIAGAKFGYDAIPKRWVNQLDNDVKAKLDEFIEYCGRRV